MCYKIGAICCLFLGFAFSQGNGKGAIDIDGNKYKSIVVGNQEWLTKNLHVSRFNNGDTIPFVDNDSDWENIELPAYWYSSSSKKYRKEGSLYNWYVVNDIRNVCPKGWHVPDDSEWTVLINFLGGSNKAGEILKNKKTFFSENKRIKINFNANLNGYKAFDGEFCDYGVKSSWWTSSENVSNTAWNRFVYSNSKSVFRDDEIKQSGLSIRCVKNKK